MYVFFVKVILAFSNPCVDKLEEGRRAARSPLGKAVLNQPEIRTMRAQLYQTVGKLKHRLRSLSPQKGSRRIEGGS